MNILSKENFKILLGIANNRYSRENRNKIFKEILRECRLLNLIFLEFWLLFKFIINGP